MVVILNKVEISSVFQSIKSQTLKKMDEFQEHDSGWTFVISHHLELNVNHYNPIEGSTFIGLSISIQIEKTCVNVKNKNEFCFKWAIIISVLFPQKSIQIE